MNTWPWSELGLPGAADLTEIRRAYALRLKEAHPEEDPEAFQRLHSAYQAACRIARRMKREEAAFGPEAEDFRAPEEKPPEPEPGPEEDEGPEAAWDYEGLWGQEPKPGEETRKKPSSQDEWDYEDLLKDEEAERPREKAPPTKSPKDWDYERLFAEGAAEAESSRRKHLEELREKNRARRAAQEQEQRRKAEDEEAAWASVMAAVHALELLHSTSAPAAEWRRFLESPVFWNVKANLDFIFALEDFLEQCGSYLPADIKRAISAAYGFEKGPGGPEYRQLYKLLGGRQEARKQKQRKVQWFRPGTKRGVKAFAGVWMALIFLGGTWGFFTSFFRDGHEEDVPWAEQCQTWLEEDWGCAFLRPFPDKGFRYYADEDKEDVREACVYAPAEHPDQYFFAYEDGERDPEAPENSPGYGTNYTQRKLMAVIQDFAQEWDYDLGYDSAGGGFNASLGETPGAYLLQFPLTGGGEAITALGELMEAVEKEDWFRKEPPEYEIFLCYGELNFYSNLSTEKEPFDADYARAVYEVRFGPNLCRYIAEESGAAVDRFGKEDYVLMEQGVVAVENERFFWVSVLEKPPESATLAHYLLSEDGGELFCVTDAQFNEGFTLAELRSGEGEVRSVENLGAHSEVKIWNDVVQ